MKNNFILAKIAILILFNLCFSLLKAQEKIDGNFIFKTWFFLEKRNIDTSSMKSKLLKERLVEKGSLLFDFFQNNVVLHLDTLRNSGFDGQFIFLSASTLQKNSKSKDSSLISTTVKNDRDSSLLLLIGSNCDQYIIGINKSSGSSYRLSGFDGNDFIAFLEDVKRGYYDIHYEKLSDTMFLKNFSVESLDFKCIYEGLISRNYFDKKRYPCLKSCSEMNGL